MDDETRGPQLISVSVADPGETWSTAGFEVENNRIRIGSLQVQTAAEVSQPAWAFDASPGVEDLDGISVTSVGGIESGRSAHSNGVVGVDHVVVLSPDLDRTTDAFDAAGLPLRRVRDLPKIKRQQRFFWAGDVIIEMVGPAKPKGDGAASIWGLALVADDLEAAAQRMGELMTTPKPAVQPGRFISAIKTDELGMSLTVAVMTPHR